VVCWGWNDEGEIGDGSATGFAVTVATPAMVSGLTNAVEIGVGVHFSCARRATGSIVCWGENQPGQLGDGTMTSRRTPVAVTGLNAATSLAVGASHSFVRRMNGELVAWGHNGAGQLGDGTTIHRQTFVTIPLR
jgi:alpha-tubulin suppressor-like RCC1 family protein